MKNHWDQIYGTKKTSELSWFQKDAGTSLLFIERAKLKSDAHIIDVGGGSSTLVDALVAKNYHNVSVLDISGEALRCSKSRLGTGASQINWMEADITQVSLPQLRYDLWHDRAVFHFLTEKSQRDRYLSQLNRALRPKGSLILATFSLEGPEKCSGLDVVRYSPESLGAELGDSFTLLESSNEVHSTPSGKKQNFVYCLFQRQY